jgi:hypothetical protein
VYLRLRQPENAVERQKRRSGYAGTMAAAR